MADIKGGDSEERPVAALIHRAADWVVANRSHWVRGLLMLAFFLVLGVVKILVGLMALFQLGALLITGEPNEPVRGFGRGLARYTHDLVAYLTCASDRPPFPFREWPPRTLLDDGDGT